MINSYFDSMMNVRGSSFRHELKLESHTPKISFNLLPTTRRSGEASWWMADTSGVLHSYYIMQSSYCKKDSNPFLSVWTKGTANWIADQMFIIIIYIIFHVPDSRKWQKLQVTLCHTECNRNNILRSASLYNWYSHVGPQGVTCKFTQAPFKDGWLSLSN